jgi:chromosome segregation ATPase
MARSTLFHLVAILASLLCSASLSPRVCSPAAITETANQQKKLVTQAAERTALQQRLGATPLQSAVRKQRISSLKAAETQLRASIAGAETRQNIALQATKGLEEERDRIEAVRQEFDKQMSTLAAERKTARSTRDSVNERVLAQQQAITALSATLAARGAGSAENSPASIQEKLADARDQISQSRVAIAAINEQVRPWLVPLASSAVNTMPRVPVSGRA